MLQRLAVLDDWARDRLSWLAERPRWAAAFLVLLCIALYMPGFASLPVTDRDEARFAQATKQMLESGNFVDIRFQHEPRYKKPIGIYWLQSLSVSTLSPDDLTQIWAYRVPSALGILAAVLLTWWAARPIFGRENALLAAALTACCLTLSLEARIAKSDAALLAAIVATQGALARLYLIPVTPARIAALFWAALGVGILIKGPVAPALTLLTIAAILIFDRDRRWLRALRPAWGVPLMLAITLPWFIAIGITSDWEFFRLSLVEDFLGKIQGGKEKHWGPPGYYFILFWLSFWPAALVAPGGVALWLWRNRVDRRALFLLAWIVPFWIAIEATPTKLPHYAMPLFPAIAMGAAWVLRGMLEGRIGAMRSYAHAVWVWLLVALGLAAAAVFLVAYFGVALSIWLPLTLAAYLAVAAVTAWAAWSRKFHAALLTAALCGLLIYIAAFRLVLPGITQFWISQQIAEVVAALRPCVTGPVALTKFHEPSAVFLLGTDTRLVNTPPALGKPNGGEATVAVIDQRSTAAYHMTGGTAASSPPSVLACIEGFNINGGKQVHLLVYGARSAAFGACPVPERYRCPVTASTR